jgi:hypothetical protein
MKTVFFCTMNPSFLLRGNPLMFTAELACEIGLYESIVLQKIVFLLERTCSGRALEKDGQRWLFNTYEEWQGKFFPFLSEKTVQRSLQNLEGRGLLISCQPEGRVSRRKYYRLGHKLEHNGLIPTHPEKTSLNPEATNQGPSGIDQIGSFRNRPNRVLPITVKTTDKTTINHREPLKNGSVHEDDETVGDDLPEPTSAKASSEGEGKASLSRQPRKRNETLDALALLDGQNLAQVTSWPRYSKLLATLKAVTPDVDAAEIGRRAAVYRRKNPTWLLTSSALVKHWGALTPESVKSSVRLGDNLQ